MNDNYDYTGEKFLNRLYKDLNNSEEVNHVMSNGNKNEKVRSYLERLEHVENLAKNSKYNGMELLKDLYYKKYVIKPENVPESYFELQKKIALERGYGHVNITRNIKQQMIDSLIEDQKKSLDIWLDYLIGNDHTYPEWFKYYAFQGMLKLGSYDKSKEQFNKRTDKTTNIFVDLNSEALALTYDNLVNVLDGKKVDDEILQQLLESGSFSKIYGYLIKKLNNQNKEINGNDGIWIKYNQGTKPDELVKSLEGKGTGWCTAGYETAKSQLQNGDFYVYYTKDNNNEFRQPRIAIRMEDNKIAEIRGIAENQNLESEMENIVEEKLNEFPDKEEYKKKVSDMKKLTVIYNEYKTRELTNEELSFLYEVDDKIIGFGYREDTRLKEILHGRNFKKDLSNVFNCSEDEISNDINDVLNSKKLVYFEGDISFSNETFIDKLTLPERVNGNLYFFNLVSAEKLELPRMVNGDLILESLTTTEGLILPETIGGSLNLGSLTTTEGLKLPERVGGSLNLESLTSSEGLKLPKTVGGSLNLGSLTITEGLILPKTVGKYLNLKSLTTAEGLKLPERVGGSLNLGGLTTPKGLILPETIGGSLNLVSLITAEGLKFPERVGGSLDLGGLTTAEGLILSETVGGSLNLGGLTTVEGLILPKTVGEYLNLISLTSAEGLILPETVGTVLYLKKLKTVKDLKFPKIVGGSLNLESLTTAEKLILPERVGGYLNLKSLTSADNVILPKTVSELYINDLISIDGLIIPQEFECYYVESDYGITVEDLKAKSLENKETEVRRMGFASSWILLVITYIVSLIASLFIFIR